MTARPAIMALYTANDVGPEEFDYPEWDKATPVSITNRWSGEPAHPSQHCEVRMLWSSEALIVRFVCRQRQPPIVFDNPDLDKKTIGLWDRDVCEVFIAPDPARPTRYYEFEAAPNGAWVDLVITVGPDSRETDWEYHSGMTTAAHVSEDVLTIIMRIPWSDRLPIPKLGDEWRANLFRCVGTGDERYLSWQPTLTDEPYFHVPEVFGRLLFV